MARHIDYRISMYQPIPSCKLHRHKVEEQVYHVLDGQDLNKKSTARATWCAKLRTSSSCRRASIVRS
jgi:hypothetical protein